MTWVQFATFLLVTLGTLPISLWVMRRVPYRYLTHTWLFGHVLPICTALLW